MVQIALPPPARPPNPLFHLLPAGTSLYRLFNPTRHGATALTFRRFGPLLRFDPHRALVGAPGLDAERGISYAGLTLSCCVVEVFGDTGMIVCGEWRVARPVLAREVRLLDLRGRGAMRAGSVAALAKTPDHTLSQAWSRWFYERPEYQEVDGLLYYNAHNDEESIALYERAASALRCPPARVRRLSHPMWRAALADIAYENHLDLYP